MKVLIDLLVKLLVDVLELQLPVVWQDELVEDAAASLTPETAREATASARIIRIMNGTRNVAWVLDIDLPFWGHALASPVDSSAGQ